MKTLTVVYHIHDEAAWRDSGNPLHYEHHGLKAHTVAIYDAVERCHGLEAELGRLRGIVSSEDARCIDAVLEYPEPR